MTEQYGLPKKAIQALRQLFQKHQKIQTIILYGSRAKGTFRTGSDIDLCMVAPSMSLRERLSIENEIDDLLLPWKIDLSLRHEIDSPELLAHLERVGVKIYP